MNKKAIILWLITFIWMIVIFIFSANDGASSVSKSKKITYEVINIVEKKKSEEEKKEKVEIIHPSVRKVAHAFEYAVLYILIISSLKASNIKVNKIYLITLIICILYATTDEIHQLFVSDRSGNVIDVLIDSSGAIIGSIIISLIVIIIRKNKEKNKLKNV